MAGVREILSLILRGFAVLVIGVSAGYFVFALVVTATDESLAAGERVSVAVALLLALGVCLLMLALRLDGVLFHGAIARRGLTGRLYVALFVCAAGHDAGRARSAEPRGSVRWRCSSSRLRSPSVCWATSMSA